MQASGNPPNGLPQKFLTEYQQTGRKEAQANSGFFAPPIALKQEQTQSPYAELDVKVIMTRQESVCDGVQAKQEKEMDKELVHGVQLARTDSDTVQLGELLQILKTKGFHFASHRFSFFSTTHDMFVNCGVEGQADGYQIPLNEIGRKQLILKACLIPAAISPPPMRILEDTKVPGRPQEGQPATAKEKTGAKGTAKRTKERKIGFIIEKVSEWRRLYAGMLDQDGKQVKYSLDEAANKVGIAKKTLDDYLLQLRAGKKYGFDFNVHKEDKVGVLRAFVKQKKTQMKGGKGEPGDKGEDSDGLEGGDDGEASDKFGDPPASK